MKTVTNFNMLDKVHAGSDSNDRANRGVKLIGWVLAAVFSAAVWTLLYFLIK